MSDDPTKRDDSELEGALPPEDEGAVEPEIVAGDPESGHDSIPREQAQEEALDVRQALVMMGPKLWVESSWGELRRNPIFRQTLAIRRFRHLWKHPILRPVALGLFLAATFGLIHDAVLGGAADTGYIWVLIAAIFLVPIGVFFFAMGAQRSDCSERIRRMRDNGSLPHYLSSGMSVDDVLLGLTHPFEMGERMGFLAMMLYFALTAADNFSFWLFMFFVAMNALSLLSRPFSVATHLEQFFSDKRLASFWQMILMAGVPLTVWFVSIISIRIGLGIFFVRTNQMGANTATIIALVAAMFISKKFGEWWMRRRLANFVRRHGSINEMLENYLAGAAS